MIPSRFYLQLTHDLIREPAGVSTSHCAGGPHLFPHVKQVLTSHVSSRTHAGVEPTQRPDMLTPRAKHKPKTEIKASVVQQTRGAIRMLEPLASPAIARVVLENIANAA
jgi:hypothetical protein